MITVILVVHLMLAIALTGVILVQKSEGGALGMGGGGGMSGFMTGQNLVVDGGTQSRFPHGGPKPFTADNDES